MVVLRAIGGFFARIGRWIKETAWIQPLLIVGAIFAVIFAIPHIIDGVKGWFSESDSANKFFASYQLSLKNAEKGTSKVDDFFTTIEKGDAEKAKSQYGERFFVAFIKDDSGCKELYEGLKTFKDKWSSKDKEFVGLDGNALKGNFKLYTIYTDSTTTVDNEEKNLFDEVWLTHYDVFEKMSNGLYLPNTYYAINQGYKASNYESAFTSDKLDTCPMSTPLVMYFDYSEDNKIATENQMVRGLSDVIFTVNGSSALERARTLKDCWAHVNKFGEVEKN